MQFSIDNSALNNILNSQEDVAKLVALLRRPGFALIVPLDTLAEAIAGGNLDFVHKRLLRLHTIIETVGPDKAWLGRDSYNWVKREHRRRGYLKNIPSLVNSPRWPNILRIFKEMEKLKEIHDSLATERDRQERIKSELRTADQNFRGRITAVPDAEIRQRIRDFSPELEWKDVEAFYPAFDSIFSRRKLKDALSGGDRYFHLRAYLGLLLLRAMGNSINAFTPDDELTFFSRIKNGNWFDLGGIVVSARISKFVTDDNDQFALASMARNCGLIKAEPIKSAALLQL